MLEHDLNTLIFRRLVAHTVLVLAGVSFVSSALGQQADQFARVVVTNVDELKKSMPEIGLGEAIAEAIGDEELADLNDDLEEGPTVSGLIRLLVALAAPDDIRHSANWNEGFAVAPVADFERFMEAVDYGSIEKRSVSKRVIAIKIDPQEIRPEKLIERAKATGKRPHGLKDLTGQTQRRRGFSAGNDRSEGDAVKVGTRIMVGIAGIEMHGEVMARDEREEAVRVRFEDLKPLAEKATNRRFRVRLERATHAIMWFPEERVQSLASSGPAEVTAMSTPRVWTDTTGKFQVVATYGGISGDRVRLTKSNGKDALVPISKLSTSDRQLVARWRSQPADPLAITRGGPKAAATGQSLDADWKSVRVVEGHDFPEWSFTPAGVSSAVSPVPTSPSASLDEPPGDSAFGPTLERLFISSDGASAIALVHDGEVIDKAFTLQFVDLATGQSEPPVSVPEETLIQDAFPEERLVIMRSNKFGAKEKNGRVHVKRLSEGRLQPVVDWKAYKPDAFFKENERAWFLANDRLLSNTSMAKEVTIWDRSTGKALYEIPVKWSHGDVYVLDPGRRFLAIGTKAAVSLIDTQQGTHVATIDHGLENLTAIAMNDGMTRLAVWAGTDLAGWDLATGEQLFRIAVPTGSHKSQLGWAGDLLLLDSEYLIDPERRIILWQYEVAGTSRAMAFARGNRILFAPEREPLGLYLGSIKVPHEAVVAKQSALGTPESMLIAKPGDPIYVTVDTDRGPETSQHLKSSIEASLAESGYAIAQSSEAGSDALEAAVICKALPSQTIRVNMSSSPFPDAWDIVERTVTPYVSRVALRRDGREVWSNGWRAGPGHMIFIQEGETLDDALRRLSKPDIERLTQMRFSSHLALPGEASPEGAYGVSRLSQQGVVNDYTGEN